MITNAARVPNSSDDSEQKNGAKVIKKQAIWHEISGIENDRRKHVQEERGRRERLDAVALRMEEKQADNDANDNQQTRLWEDRRKFRRHMETCCINNQLVTYSQTKSQAVIVKAIYIV